jgi:hypothetical protein
MIITKKDWVIDVEKVLSWLKDLSDWTYEIVKFKKDRTSQQNRYLRWVVYKTIADFTGYDTNYIHQQLGQLFLVDYETYKNPYIKSTAELTTQEFGEYVDKIILRAGEYGLRIPSPEEYFNLQ